MLKRFALGLVTLALSAGLLFAHGDPLTGTVTAVTKDTVTIKDKDNKTVIIMLEKTTKFQKDGKAAKVADLKVGSRVVIDAMMDTKMKMYVAEEIQVGAAAAATPAPAPAPKN